MDKLTWLLKKEIKAKKDNSPDFYRLKLDRVLEDAKIACQWLEQENTVTFSFLEMMILLQEIKDNLDLTTTKE